MNLVNALNSFPPKKELINDKSELLPCQWIQCDLRFMDFTFLGEQQIKIQLLKAYLSNLLCNIFNFHKCCVIQENLP